MTLDIATASSTDPVPADSAVLAASGSDLPDLRIFVFALFFTFGGITSLNDVIIPKLKALFTLTYAEAMLVQSAFFAAYFIVSLPAASVRAITRNSGSVRASTATRTLATMSSSGITRR